MRLFKREVFTDETKNHLRAFFWIAIGVLLGLVTFRMGDFIDSQKQIFVIYIGFLFALFVFFVVDFFRRPNFKVYVGAINEKPNGDWRFLHVNVINLDWPKWFFLFRRDLANNTSAEVIFKKKDFGKTIFSMEGRWSMNLKPITPFFSSASPNPRQFIYDQELARKGAIIDMSPSKDTGDLREGKLVIAFKSKDENECYGFNDQSYNPSQWEHDERPFRNTSQKLERGVYDTEVIIRSGRTISKKVFVLENLGDTLDKFILREKD